MDNFIGSLDNGGAFPRHEDGSVAHIVFGEVPEWEKHRFFAMPYY